MINLQACNIITRVSNHAKCKDMSFSLRPCIDTDTKPCAQHNVDMKLLDPIRKVYHIRHYSPGTEGAYPRWIERFLPLHREKASDVCFRKMAIGFGKAQAPQIVV